MRKVDTVRSFLAFIASVKALLMSSRIKSSLLHVTGAASMRASVEKCNRGPGYFDQTERPATISDFDSQVLSAVRTGRRDSPLRPPYILRQVYVPAATRARNAKAPSGTKGNHSHDDKYREQNANKNMQLEPFLKEDN